MSQPALVVTDLVRKFGDFTAVDHVSLEVQPGEVFGFLGPNGCGKSTTIKMICGLLAPTAGRIVVDGLDVATQAEAIRARLGYVAQFFNLYDTLTVRENLLFFGGVYGVPAGELEQRVDHWIDRLDLGGVAGQRAGQISVGLQRSLALAAAVLHEPVMLLLDEPTSGVDPVARRAFFEVIAELAASGAAVLVTTHVMDEAERCHRLSLMNRGRLVTEGTPTEIRALAGGSIWQVEVAPAGRALTLAESRADLSAVALFGTKLQYRVAEENGTGAPEAVAEWLREQGITTGPPKPVRPTIEHVFLQVLRDAPEEQP
ncbi:MAG TPA: multidrug ABC transporter ATP-binding protein [Armatimonadetes bacterium]|nr:multidrug ABC transporter ATP-binding protein [Armatimonadota bacterium]